MSSGSIAGMTLGASDIIVEGNTVPMAVLESGEKNTNVLAIVLGICIPVVVLSKYLSNLSHYWYNRMSLLQEEGCQPA